MPKTQHILNCLIVEDEPLAAAILEDYIRQIPWMRFAGRCSNAAQAMEAFQQEPLDVLFLDIHLPGQKGLDFLQALAPQPQTILTTAYQEYAVEGFDLGVIDYLLKPIDFERFLKAIHKLRRPETENRISRQTRAFHFFNVNKKMVRVWLDEVVYVESLKEYVRLNLTDGRSVVTKGQISEMEVLLGLWRIHRSFLVSLAHVEAYSSNEITAGSQTLPIGGQYKDQTLEKLAQFSSGHSD
ncbi:MAG: response regulator transcription factor [Lewinellaceae bacterium]|nr:response regulator transcription factor [Lewinellaceae bacterium]